MKKLRTEIFRLVLSLCSEFSEVPESEILLSKKGLPSDVRYALVRILSDYGFTDSEISMYLSKSRASVCIMRNRFSNKMLRPLFKDSFNRLQIIVKQMIDNVKTDSL